MNELQTAKLTERQMELVDLMVSSGGTHQEIADLMQADRAWVSKTLKKPHVSLYLSEQMALGIASLSVSALNTVRDLLKSRSDYVRLQAAQDILDRAGYKPIERKQVAVKADVKFTIDLT